MVRKKFAGYTTPSEVVNNRLQARTKAHRLLVHLGFAGGAIERA